MRTLLGRITQWITEWFGGRARRERDLDDEIRAHLEMAIRDRVARGELREEAERAVRREFGNQVRVKEVTRAMWGGVWLDQLRQDVRVGVRSLGRTPGFTAVSLLTLGLGIGLTTSVFTVANGVLFRPLPFPEPDRLVRLSTFADDAPDERRGLPSEYKTSIESLSSFSKVGAYLNYPPLTLTGSGDPVRLAASFVTRDLLEAVGIAPSIGRWFDEEEHVSGAAVLLSNALWRDRFGSDPGVIGETLDLDGRPVVVIGVMPAGFNDPEGAGIWLPAAASPYTGPSYYLTFVARLADGVSTKRATDELTSFISGKGRMPGQEARDVGIRVEALKDVVVGETRRPLLLLFGAVGLVLLIAVINVAGLLLTRANGRAREMGLRSALGAGRVRLARQLLTETLVLAASGGALGLGLAWIGVTSLLALAPPGAIPRGGEIGIDLDALLFTFCVVTVVGLMVGVAPAIRAAWNEMGQSARGRGGTESHQTRAIRNALVVGEVGVAVVLLFGAGLLIRSFRELRAIDLGFVPTGTLSMQVDLPESRYAEVAPIRALHQRVLEGLRSIPGVRIAGAANLEPFGPVGRSSNIRVEGLPPGPSGSNAQTQFSIVGPGYLGAMGIQVLSGRNFDDTDVAGAPGVVLVSQEMADRFWPDGSALGRRIARSRGAWLTVVGVVDDVVRSDLLEETAPMYYLPLAQVEEAYLLNHVQYVVRTPDSSAAMTQAMRDVLTGADPGLAAGSIASVDDLVLSTVGDRLFQTRLLTVFAIMALVLSAVGVFGMTAQTVGARTREIGIRMALGAKPRQVVWSILARTLTLTLIGLTLGCVISLGGARVLAASLYKVTPLDPATLAGVAAILVLTSLLAAYLPARRASRVDPSIVLRSD